MSEIEVIKLQARRVGNSTHYSITIPKEYIKKLKWSKGDILAIRIVKHRIDDKEYEGIFVFKPSLP